MHDYPLLRSWLTSVLSSESSSGRVVGNDLLAEVRRFIGAPDVGASENLKRLFKIELSNYETAVRHGDIDPSDGYHPTLGSAIDSLAQAPDDTRRVWLGLERALVGPVDNEDADKAIATLIELANLVALCGPEAKLADFA